MVDKLTDHIKQILSETGYSGNTSNVDFSWISNSGNKELREVSKWFTTYISEDNYITEDELKLVKNLKNKGVFVESPEELNENEVFNVLDENLTEANIESVKNELSEINNKICDLTNLKELMNSELDNYETDLENCKKKLKDAETKCQSTFNECLKYNEKLNLKLQEIKSGTKKISTQLKEHFLEQKLQKCYFMAGPSQDYYIQCSRFKKKVDSIFKKRNYWDSQNSSSIPVATSNCIQNIANRSFYSSSSSNENLVSLYDELVKIKMCLSKNLFSKFENEEKEQELAKYLSILKEIKKEDPLMLKLQFMNWSNEGAVCGFETRNESFDNSTLELLKNECYRWAECQEILSLINVANSIIVRHEEKLDAFDKFAHILEMNSISLDFCWMAIKTDSQFLEDLTLIDIKNYFDNELRNHSERMVHLKDILAGKHDSLSISSNLNESSEFFKIIPSSASNGEGIETTINEISELKSHVNFSEDLLIKSIENLMCSFIERFKQCNLLKDAIFNGPTKKLGCNKAASELKPVESEINFIRESIMEKILEVNEVQKQILRNPAIFNNRFQWVKYVMKHQQQHNVSEEDENL